MDEQYQHQPVLLNEVLESLQIYTDGIYLDATFGRGGHARAILDRLSSKGRLLVIDKDPQAIAVARLLAREDARVTVLEGSFIEMQMQASACNVFSKVNGILLDLGVSSPQLDDPSRGFSFLQEGPLDMRMDPTQGISAAQWLAQVSEKNLAQVLKDYGEERYAKRIARAIIENRQQNPITTTKALAEIVSKANPAWEKHKHPATRSFQAIRIYINNELAELQNVLQQALEVLAIGGRLAVISFHSLEDRIVKQFIRKQQKGLELPKDLPVREAQLKQRLKKINGAIRATNTEIKNNPRARSAILRVAEKIA